MCIWSFAGSLCYCTWTCLIVVQGEVWNDYEVCIILHNMIVEDERDTYNVNFDLLSAYDDTPNGLAKRELRELTFAPYEEYIRNHI